MNTGLQLEVKNGFRFEVLRSVIMNRFIFWDVMYCSLLEVN
jgi:hypothetical protein